MNLYDAANTCPDYVVTSGKRSFVLYPTALDDCTLPPEPIDITLQWATPTKNADCSVVDDLAGFNIYWDGIPFVENLPPETTSFDVVGIPPGVVIFTVTAYDFDGNESIPSDPYVIYNN